MATTELIRQLLEAGVHFGHQTKKWNPKMKRFIFGQRSGIYIIDLEQTATALIKACDFLRSKAKEGREILFVGTKKQAQDVIKEEATRCNMFFVNQRWLGGTLTNFSTIKKNVERLKDYYKMQESGQLDALTKKEATGIKKEIEKLSKNLTGLIEMKRLPGALFVVDSKKEEIAIKEAKRLSIPVVSLLDTNCDPDMVDVVIPGNDDAIKSIKFVTSLITDAILEGRRSFMETTAKVEQPTPAKADEAKEGKEKPKTMIVEEGIIEEVEEVVQKKIKQ